MKVVTIALLAAALIVTEARALELCDVPGKSEEFYAGVKPTIDLLKQRKFAELDAKMNAILAAQQAGRMSDELAHRASSYFFHAEPSWEPPIREWIAQFPRSQAARIALAYHLSGRGWTARGEQFASKTSAEQFAQMEDHFKQALNALDEADARGRKLTLSIAQRIALASSTRALGLNPTLLYREGIKAHPESLHIRVSYLEKSGPKWGGSFERLQAILAEAKPLGDADRRYLEYLVYQEVASTYWCGIKMGCIEVDASAPKRVVEYYEKSIAACPGLDKSLELLVGYLQEKRDYPALIGASSRLIERKPRLAWVYDSRGMAYGNSGRLKEAFADYDRASQLGDPYALKELAWFYESGTTVPKDVHKAIDLYMVAASRNVDGARQQAERLSKSSGIPLK